VTRPGHLERRYRRSLAWYPRAFRREHGEEILGVLIFTRESGSHYKPPPAHG
jgi:hypothetical protein